jgi:hypothetical protein
MQPSFLQSYLSAFHRMRGWFSYDAALMFMAYNQLNRAAGISGDTLEIGVYQGLSAIAVAALRGEGRKLYAIDLFEELGANEAYGSGASYRKIFEENFRSVYGMLDFVQIVVGASGKLKPADFPHSFSFCHVDGGHSPQETCDDLRFASAILVPGGLLALDDYFNPQHPGVCEGAINFMRRHEGLLRPVAIGYNKVLFQKLPASLDLNAEFSKAFPHVPHSESRMWDRQAILFGEPLRYYFDLYASTPELFVRLGEAGTRAAFAPEMHRIKSRAGKMLSLPVTVKNTSQETFPHGDGVMGLSYHLQSSAGETLQHDNPRAYLKAPLEPGDQARLMLSVTAPAVPGGYRIEIDLVREGVMWFADVGNPTCLVEFEVS